MTARLSQERIDRAELLSRSHSSRTVSMLTGLSRSLLHKFHQRQWRAMESKHRKRPTDFAIQNRHMSADELCAHYRTSTRTVARWRRELKG